MKKKVAVLGVSGSIGKSALDVIRQGNADGKSHFEPVLFSANKNKAALDEAGVEWPSAEKILSGEEGGRERLLGAIAGSGAHIVLNGISGSAGLGPSMAAIESGCDLALANKETLVMAGPLAMRLAREKNASIIPVDSEHSAVFHLVNAFGKDSVDEVILTASGGPFLNNSIEEMALAGPQDALAHPTWNMGAKISIDSATMANKGLEVIEAAVLFSIGPEKIKVVVHPQSIVHSMVRLKSGEVYAQMSRPDMRGPIRSALYWPKTPLWAGEASSFNRLDFGKGPLTLEFFPPDIKKFPLLPLAYVAARKGGLYPCAYNGANEACVAAFLAGRIGFLDIARITGYVLDKDWSGEPCSVAAVMEADKEAKLLAEKGINSEAT
jgi:1-deoxy-D-xylulose-5-phosphate reductoisomerase